MNRRQKLKALKKNISNQVLRNWWMKNNAIIFKYPSLWEIDYFKRIRKWEHNNYDKLEVQINE